LTKKQPEIHAAGRPFDEFGKLISRDGAVNMTIRGPVGQRRRPRVRL
jgi:hypothetical protein